MAARGVVHDEAAALAAIALLSKEIEASSSYHWCGAVAEPAALIKLTKEALMPVLDGRRHRTILAGFLSVVLLLLITGCGSSPSGPTGFGATVASWNHAHHADPNFAEAYDPMPSLGERYNDRYFVVHASNGRIDGYQMRLSRGTGIDAARAVALQEFPADRQVSWFRIKKTCAQMQIHSAAAGTALAEFLSSDTGPFTRANVTGIIFLNLPPSSANSSIDC